MDSKLLEKTREKLKHDLSSEEQEVLRKCSATINTHTRIGAILGGSLSVYGMYRRKLWPLSKFWGRGLFFGVGGVVVGMQLGLVSASFQCVNIVQSLPNPDHVMKALREIQVELQDARRRPLQEKREWHQRSEDDPTPVDVNSEAYQGPPRDDATPGNAWESSPYQNSRTGESTSPYDGPGSAPVTPEVQNRGAVGTQKEQSQNIWQQIRGETSGRPETAWDRLRKTGSSAEQKPVPQGTPFGEDSSQASLDVRDSPETSSDPRELERVKQQSEFDRLLEKERLGEAENASRRKGKYGDYE